MSDQQPLPESDVPPMPTPEEPTAPELAPPDAAGGQQASGRAQASGGVQASPGAAPASGGDVIGATTPGQSEGAIKDPEDWVTGDEPMTDSQRSYLDTLAKQAGEQLPADLTKAQASEHIDRLQSKTGRGRQG